MQISLLYSALMRYTSISVVKHNATVEFAMSASIEKGHAWIDRIEARGVLPEYHLLHAAGIAHLYRRLHEVSYKF